MHGTHALWGTGPSKSVVTEATSSCTKTIAASPPRRKCQEFSVVMSNEARKKGSWVHVLPIYPKWPATLSANPWQTVSCVRGTIKLVLEADVQYPLLTQDTNSSKHHNWLSKTSKPSTLDTILWTLLNKLVPGVSCSVTNGTQCHVDKVSLMPGTRNSRPPP